MLINFVTTLAFVFGFLSLIRVVALFREARNEERILYREIYTDAAYRAGALFFVCLAWIVAWAMN